MYAWSGALLESDRETGKLKPGTKHGRNLSPPKREKKKKKRQIILRLSTIYLRNMYIVYTAYVIVHTYIHKLLTY